MKKAILYLLAGVSLFCSCKKDQKKISNPVAKTYKVSFNVSDISQHTLGSGSNLKAKDLKTDAAPNASIIDALVYTYFSGSTIGSTVSQDSDNPNFGNISFDVPAGTYTFTFAGIKKGALIGQDGNGNQVIAGYKGTGFPYTGSSWPWWQDTFFAKVSVTIPAANTNQAITLERIVCQLAVNIEDAIPSNASKLVIKCDQIQSFSRLTGTPVATSLSKDISLSIPIPATAIGKTNFKNTIIMLPNSNPVTVTITCLDSGNNAIAQNIVSNVTTVANTQTFLTGNLFSSGVGGQVGLSPFDPAATTIHF